MYRETDEQYIEAIIPQIKKAMEALALKAQNDVPEHGEFEKINEVFKDSSGKLDITDWWISICCLKGGEDNRYIELSGYLGGGYKTSSIEASGTKDDCLKALNSPYFLGKLKESIRRKLEWSEI